MKDYLLTLLTIYVNYCYLKVVVSSRGKRLQLPIWLLTCPTCWPASISWINNLLTSPSANHHTSGLPSPHIGSTYPKT